jgi:superfamily II DNA or RNA helicase
VSVAVNFKIKVGQKLRLPSVQAYLRRPKNGLIEQQLRAPIETTITEITAPPRVTSYLLATFDNGETIAVADSKPVRPDPNLAGLLKILPGGQPKWIRHRLIRRQFPQNAINEYAMARADVFRSFESGFMFQSDPTLREPTFSTGLHNHQIGAIHAIGAHWSVSSEPASLVLPTGTGKTEIMLATLVSYVRGTLLVVVPSVALRDQTAKKFASLGLLRKLGHLVPKVQYPIVGTLINRIKSADDLEIFDSCNIVVATISTIAQGTAEGFGDLIRNKCSHLIIDEAHHVPARTWNALRNAFSPKPVLQFTATPFRRDNKLLEGTCIFNYSLAAAQRDGFFQHIDFTGVDEPDDNLADEAIAKAAVDRLKQDLKDKRDHILLARCSRKIRADKVFGIYQRIASKYNPVLIYSEKKAAKADLEQILNRGSRIVVCVDMFGEGFDLPQLKIAAVHDPHKSLSIFLQFIGRFTRSVAQDLGAATIVANVATKDITNSFEDLYCEDADWNSLLRNYASQAVRDYAETVALLEESEPVELAPDALRDVNIPASSLRPKYSTVAFRVNNFRPLLFAKGLPQNRIPHVAWHNTKRNLFFFVTAENPRIPWSRAKNFAELRWHLYVMYYQEQHKVLFIHSSDNSLLHFELAKAVSDDDAAIISGETVFRVFSDINRLLFHNVGLKRREKRNLRFSQHIGGDVGQALTDVQTTSSTKSNIYGTGYESGDPTNIGCSYKGRIWTREQGTLKGFIEWCDSISEKLRDDTFDTNELIAGALIYEEVSGFPQIPVLAMLWPKDFWERVEDNVSFRSGNDEIKLCDCTLEVISCSAQELRFRVLYSQATDFSMKFSTNNKIVVSHAAGPRLTLTLGRKEHDAATWLSENPPEIIFIDGSELDGPLWIHAQAPRHVTIPDDRFETWNWTGTNIEVESMWRTGAIDQTSVQYKIADQLRRDGFDIVFDDDGSGEAADLVCLKEHSNSILIQLVHCKFSGRAQSGGRVTDVMEVCAQAVRSYKWKYKFDALCEHITNRERGATKSARGTRFFVGDMAKLRTIRSSARNKKKEYAIKIAQPGLSLNALTDEQRSVFASTHAFLLETVDVAIRILCSP